MKLKKVTKHDPIARLAVSIHQSTMDLLSAYQAHYKATYGEDIERSHLVEEVLRDYMEADKNFVKAMEKARERPAAKSDKPAPASPDFPEFQSERFPE